MDMLQGWIIDFGQSEFCEVETKLLQQRQAEKKPLQPREEGQILWIDLSDPTDDDFDHLAARVKLHPAVIENLRQTESRPKLQQFQKYFHMTAYDIQKSTPTALVGQDEIDAGAFGVKLREIDFLVGDDYIITVHSGKMSAWETLARNWNNRLPRIEGGTAYVVYELLDSILEGYFPILDDLGDRIDELEDILFTGTNQAVTSEVFALKRMLIRIRQVSSPLREVVGQLSRHYSTDADANHVYFQDLYDHAMRILDMLDSFRDLLSDSMDVYLAAQSNRMNEVMKTLTSFSIIFLLPTLIVGIYGMNWENMPELHNPYGYFICLGVIIVSMIINYMYFKRKGWI